MRDGSGFMQVVLEQERLKPDQWEQAKEASLESSIVVKGVAKVSLVHLVDMKSMQITLKRFT